MPDADENPDVDADAPSTPILGVVHPPGPEQQTLDIDVVISAAHKGLRDALTAVDAELTHLREQRSEDDREGLAEIARKKAAVKAKRLDTNRRIKNLLAQREPLARQVRVLDQP